MKLTSLVLGLAAVAGNLAAAPASAQQPDLYSIPAKSKYSLLTFAGKRPLTRAERTNFLETSHYDDVIQFIDSLKLLGAKIVVGSIGKTSQGREQPYVIASRPLVSTPAEARALNRPIAYIQANIHAGEVEGKEAMLAMLRDLVFDTKKNVLDSIVLIVQPIYNADGNEMFGPQARNRNNQNGPELVGQRHSGQDYDLNRDYVKLDAPETRSSIAAFNAWNPDVFMDLHTTDGSIHGYSLTYSPPLNPASVTVRPYVVDTLLPAIRQRMRDRDGFETNDYGDFARSGPGASGAGRGASLEAAVAVSIPTEGWVFSTYEPFPRYGTNYYGLRGRISILSEAFSHDPFARRVASTYDFVAEVLSFTAEHHKEILAVGRQSDHNLAVWAAAPSTSPAISLQSRKDTTRMEDVRVEMLAPLADPAKAEPGMGNRQRTGVIKLVHMPVMV
ncbi:MAG TPA: M14 family metallopeptidase, partial [Gemmatimonadaceae bacterium]|nr:M14 family metallopeptidase [Gemmatimonadaceae bacterium]